jgi:hypothetical protein
MHNYDIHIILRCHRALLKVNIPALHQQLINGPQREVIRNNCNSTNIKSTPLQEQQKQPSSWQRLHRHQMKEFPIERDMALLSCKLIFQELILSLMSSIKPKY